MSSLFLITVPMLIVGVLVIYDIATRPDLSRSRRVLWIMSVVFVWPVQIVYLLVRPVGGRNSLSAGNGDLIPSSKLAQAYSLQRAGVLSESARSELAEELRGRQV